MTATEADRSALAQGVYDAIADLRELSLHDVVDAYVALGRGHASMYWSGYSAVLVEAQRQVWDLWRSSRTPQPTRVIGSTP
ncbi:MAG TPA: hypothetical protein VIL77_14380 [Gaiellaceae bacterium]